MLSRSASLHCKPRNPSLQVSRPPPLLFLPQRPNRMLRLLRHHVICRVPASSGKGMVPVLNRSAARMGLVRVMALSLSVTHNLSAMGSVDL